MVNMTETQIFNVAIGLSIQFDVEWALDRYFWTILSKWPLSTILVVTNGQYDRKSNFLGDHRIKNSIWRRMSPRSVILNDFIKMTTLDHLSGQKRPKWQKPEIPKAPSDSVAQNYSEKILQKSTTLFLIFTCRTLDAPHFTMIYRLTDII